MKRSPIAPTLALILLLLLPLTTATAQKRKKPASRKRPVVEVKAPEAEEDPLVQEMLEATQRVIFIDSVVVKKTDLLRHIHLSPEAGRLSGCGRQTVYQNEMGNKRYLVSGGRLCTSDLLNGEWSAPTRLEGIGQFSEVATPFMMPDGVTLYFAARGAGSLSGGLDIYVTRYDAENQRFLKAENIGMPFSSEADDYLYIIDEDAQLGYFVSERRQRAGEACIYVFIPSEMRATYSTDEHDEQFVRSRARIDRIADTWGNGQERREAMERLKAVRNTPLATGGAQPTAILFTVDDQTTYTSLSDFRHPEGARRYQQLEAMKAELEQLDGKLRQQRDDYATAGQQQRQRLAPEIRNGEERLLELERSISLTAKEIRNAEITSRKQ